ncbi:winged helix-turn-helix transcriptional regulator [Streptomyces sp. NPDC051976]|uniref:winged helix-turn-helix transcriptional regulator n=1 Tax=Streptomyces sp. NPDC051976 TaxID=3154947 RepID=UPI00341B090B
MAGKRSYDDPCGVARALGAVGERWALLVVRELLHGPKRFGDLSRGLPGMSQNVLSQRLRELEAADVVRRVRLGPPASTSGYELTERGALLEPVLFALATWGSRLPLGTGSDAELSVDALVLALRTTFDPAAADDLRVVCELRMGDDRFRAEIGDARFRATRATASASASASAESAAALPVPDAVLTAGVGTLRALVFGGRPLADALRAGDAHLTGDRRRAARFLACFPRPPIA